MGISSILIKSHRSGTIEFCVEFRVFDYKQWYPDWKADEEEEEDSLPPTRRMARFEDMFPTQNIRFPEHSLDVKKGLDMYWERHDKFARKGK